MADKEAGASRENSETVEKPQPLRNIPDKIRDQMPVAVKKSAKSWDEVDAEGFVEDFKRKRKSLGATYILWLLFGWH